MNWTPILNCLILIVASLIAAFLIPLIRQKMTSEEWNNLLAVIDMAVSAAEQTIPGGEEKKAFVMAYLESLGISMDETTMNAIEAAVLRLHAELYGVVK